MRVGFVGLGDMGAPMAQAIAKSDGIELVVWARRAQTLDSLRDVAFTAAASPAEMGAGCDVVCLCLRYDSDFEEVVFERGLVNAVPRGGVLVNHGTGSPEACVRWEARAAAHNVHLLDAPVSGGHEVALDSRLTTMVGGDRDSAERCRSVFEMFSSLVVYLGPAGSGQIAKLLNNAMLAANFMNSAELLRLARDLDFDVGALARVISASSGGSVAFESLTKVISEDLAPHVAVMLGKDVRHLSDVARSRGIPATRIEETARLGVEALVQSVEDWHHQR